MRSLTLPLQRAKNVPWTNLEAQKTERVRTFKIRWFRSTRRPFRLGITASEWGHGSKCCLWRRHRSHHVLIYRPTHRSSGLPFGRKNPALNKALGLRRYKTSNIDDTNKVWTIPIEYHLLTQNYIQYSWPQTCRANKVIQLFSFTKFCVAR